MKLNNLDVDWEADDAAWAAFPKPEEMYSEPPMVSVFPEPPPEPPLSGAPKVPVDQELYDAEARDRQTRALRALEQGGLDVIAGMTQIRPHQALTQPTADAAELRQRRMLEDKAMLERSKATWEQSNDLMRNLIAMRTAGSGLYSTARDPVIAANESVAIQKIQSEARVEVARREAEAAVIKAGGTLEAARIAADAAAKKQQALETQGQNKDEEERKAKEKKEADAAAQREAAAQKERDRLAAAAGRGSGRRTSAGGAGKGGSKVEGGARLPPTVATEIATFPTAWDMLDNAEKQFQRLGGTGAWAKVEGAVTERLGLQSGAAAEFNAAGNVVRQAVGKILEGGKLAAGDEGKYKRMMPVFGDSKEVVANKLSTLRAYLKSDLKRKMEALSASYELPTITMGGDVYGRAPQAKASPTAPSAAGTIAKLEAWIAANPKHPRLGEAQSKLQALKSKAGAK